MNVEKIMTKISELEKNLEIFSEIAPTSEEEYSSSLIKKLANERLLQISIECVLDICFLLVKELKLGPPPDEENVIDLLKDKLPKIATIKDMKRFRNVLVHKYGEVDDELVYKFLTENLDDFQEFIQDIEALIKRIQNK